MSFVLLMLYCSESSCQADCPFPQHTVLFFAMYRCSIVLYGRYRGLHDVPSTRKATLLS